MAGRCLRCCVVPILTVFGECAVFYYSGRLRLFKYWICGCLAGPFLYTLWMLRVMLLWLAGFHWYLQLLFVSPAWF